MKRFFLVILLFLLFFLFPQNAQALTTSYSNYSSSSGYIIKSFVSEIEVQQDTSLIVTETLKVGFSAQKHGIIRVVPYIYAANGQTINARMEIVSVTNEKGVPYKFTESGLAQSKKLQIGDANTFTQKEMTYVIKYKMHNILLKYDGKPEVYWNVTGHEWDTIIVDAEAKVTSNFADVTKVACFEGPLGSTSGCKYSFDTKSAQFTAKNPVMSGQDFTIVVGLSDLNSLIFPSPVVKAVDNWGYLPALLPFILMFLFWFLKGRDKKYVGDNIYYKPDKLKEETVSFFTRKFLPLVYAPIKGLTPAEVGTINDETVNTNDVVAEIVELARLGYLKIEKIKDKKLFSEAEYAFIKLKENNDEKLTDFQSQIFKELFRSDVVSGSIKEIEKLYKGKHDLAAKQQLAIEKKIVLLSSLKEHFYVALTLIKKKIYSDLVTKEIFAGNPDTTRKAWFSGYIIFSLFFGFVTFVYAFGTFNFAPLLVGFVAFIAGFPFALSMPRKTAWGYSLSRQIVGLKDYLRVGKWREDYKEKKLFFDEIVPLAIALGVVDNLASDMKDLGIEPPSYFGNTSSTVFYSDITSFQRSLSYALVVGPAGNTNWSGSSSWSGHSSWSGGSGFSGGGGGGSSGGGFGGGGGGSW